VARQPDSRLVTGDIVDTLGVLRSTFDAGSGTDGFV
jgi:hypothetical protein